VRGDSLDERAADWQGRLAESTWDRTPAASLYAGQHWASVLRALELAQQHGVRANLWIASAGLGLVRGDDSVPPYSATFAAGTPDSVRLSQADGSHASAASAWWSLITQRRIDDVVEQGQYDAVLVAAGSLYVDAMSQELSRCDASGSTLLVASVGARRSHPELTLDIGPSVQEMLGGSLGSLNARSIEHIIGTHQTHGFDRDAVQQSFDKLATKAKSRQVVTTPRVRLTDAEVQSAIRSLLAADPGLSASRALARLRSEHGIACEQRRFAGLYASVH
jgi:hypothetical protein